MVLVNASSIWFILFLTISASAHSSAANVGHHLANRGRSGAVGASTVAHSRMPPANTTETGTKKKVRGRGKRTNSMRIYVKKLAKNNVDHSIQISSGAADKLEFYCDELIQRITRRAGLVMELKRTRTLNSHCVQGALSLELHPTLARRCDEAGVAAVLKLTQK